LSNKNLELVVGSCLLALFGSLCSEKGKFNLSKVEARTGRSLVNMMWCARTSRRFLAASSTPRPDAFDVIVVGSGFAGLSAAIEALKEGRKVLILERSGVAGGVSAHSSGKASSRVH
jgi:heterodisulfide reductase subunit A-like polyferredoxin